MTLTRRLTHTLLAATALLWPALAAAQTERPSPEQIEQMLEPLRPTVSIRRLRSWSADGPRRSPIRLEAHPREPRVSS